MSDQDILLKIVQKWDIRKTPEFRGFRCARCQNYEVRAWHHLLMNDKFLAPVHFCESCEIMFSSEKIDSSPTQTVNIDPQSINFSYSSSAVRRFGEISKHWNLNAPIVLKPFACDECGKDLPDAKGYHAWWNDKGRLIEFHFDPVCAQKLRIADS